MHKGHSQNQVLNLFKWLLHIFARYLLLHFIHKECVCAEWSALLSSVYHVFCRTCVAWKLHLLWRWRGVRRKGCWNWFSAASCHHRRFYEALILGKREERESRDCFNQLDCAGRVWSTLYMNYIGRLLSPLWVFILTHLQAVRHHCAIHGLIGRALGRARQEIHAQPFLCFLNLCL